MVSKATFQISPGKVALQYTNSLTRKGHPKNLKQNKTEKEKAVPMLSENKKKHENKRTEQFDAIEEYKKKLQLLGVTVLEYGPAHMRLLGYLLNKYKGENTAKSKTEKLDEIFNGKNLGNQSNKKQQEETLSLYRLIKKLKVEKNCDQGIKLLADLQENEDQPNRSIYLFLKTIDGKQYVVGFLSASKKAQHANCAVVDYVCPKLKTAPKDGSIWSSKENVDNLAAYVILKFLWFNNEKGEDKYKYTGVFYKGVQYESYPQVLKKLSSLKIDTFAKEIIGVS